MTEDALMELAVKNHNTCRFSSFTAAMRDLDNCLDYVYCHPLFTRLRNDSVN